jgi:replicative DNA helicase
MEQEDSGTGLGRTRRNRPRLVVSDEAAALRVPPHSLEAEQAVLGGLLLDNSTWDAIADRLRAEDFYRRDHQLIYQSILELSQRGEPSDAVTVAEHLTKNGLAEETGGLAYLARRLPRTSRRTRTSCASVRCCGR